MLIPVSAFVARTSETNTPQNTHTHISFVHRHRIPIIIIPNDANINRERESYPIWFWTKHTHTFVHTRVSEPRDDEWEIKRKVETSNIHCGLHNLLAPTKDADDVATGCWELNGVGDGDDDDLCGSVREKESSVCWHGTVQQQSRRNSYGQSGTNWSNNSFRVVFLNVYHFIWRKRGNCLLEKR